MRKQTNNRFSPEVHQHAVRLVLERENRELRQANEILRKASAYLAAAELDSQRTAMAALSEEAETSGSAMAFEPQVADKAKRLGIPVWTFGGA
jgi:hypothetical protein